MYRVRLEDGYNRVPFDYNDIRDVMDLIRASIDNIRGESPQIVIQKIEEPVNEENPD